MSQIEPHSLTASKSPIVARPVASPTEPSAPMSLVIATTSFRRALLWVLPFIIVVALVILEFGLLSYLDSISARYSGRPRHPIPRVLLIGVAGGMLIAVLFKLLILARERDLAVVGGQLLARSASNNLLTIELADILAIRRFESGTFIAMWMDRGVGLILKKPIKAWHYSVRHDLMMRWLYRRRSCHVLITPTYSQSMDQIATAIAQSVQSHCRRTIPILNLTDEFSPEGQFEMAGLAPLARIARPVAARPIAHLPGIACIECGYDLRMQDRSAACPECGTPVARSIGGRTLANADASWVARLQLGAAFLAASGFLGILLVRAVADRVLRAISGIQRTTWELSTTLILAAVTLFVLALGGWWFTTGEPTRIRITPSPRTRIASRLAIAFLALSAIAGLLGLTHLTVAVELTAWAVLVLAGLLLVYGRKILLRIPRPGLARISGISAAPFIILAVVILPLFGPRWLARTAPGMKPSWLPTPAAGPATTRPSTAELHEVGQVLAFVAVAPPLVFSINFIVAWFCLKLARVSRHDQTSSDPSTGATTL